MIKITGENYRFYRNYIAFSKWFVQRVEEIERRL